MALASLEVQTIERHKRGEPPRKVKAPEQATAAELDRIRQCGAAVRAVTMALQGTKGKARTEAREALESADADALAAGRAPAARIAAKSKKKGGKKKDKPDA